MGTVPQSVDKVLETLLRWMLATEAAERPDMQAILAHDWCRKRFPRTGKAVSAPPHVSDPLLSTTVLPYLENLHFPSPPGSSAGSPQHEGGETTVTEHQLRMRREEQERAEQEEEGEAAKEARQMLVRKKSKTTSCIKLKNGCKTQ